jgi:hypothetical protein
MTTPMGLLKVAAVPTPSEYDAAPGLPASVVTAPPALILIARITWFE